MIAVNALVISEGILSLLLDDRLIRSSDKGQSWTRVTTFPEQTGMALVVARPHILVGLSNGEVLVLDTHNIEP